MKKFFVLWRNRILWMITSFSFRVLRKLNLFTRRKSYFTVDENRSDSEVTPYSKSLLRILSNERRLTRFRRGRAYREILEHLGYKEGKKYLQRIQTLASKEDAVELINLNKGNDLFGTPITFSYGNYGNVSPTTLRYISTALEIANNFEVLSRTSIVEIGCGYGGQAAVIRRTFGVKDYTCFDLPPVLKLIDRYLQGIDSDLTVKRGSFNQESKSWDLAISNYAFSELSRDLQLSYLEEILSNCKSGFMIMNSGVSNETGRSTGKLTIEEIRQFLPNMRLIEEIPLTGPDNYVIIWGEKK